MHHVDIRRNINGPANSRGGQRTRRFPEGAGPGAKPPVAPLSPLTWLLRRMGADEREKG